MNIDDVSVVIKIKGLCPPQVSLVPTTENLLTENLLPKIKKKKQHLHERICAKLKSRPHPKNISRYAHVINIHIIIQHF